MADYVNYYANVKNYYFEFYSLISGRTVEFPALLNKLDDKFTSNWSSQTVFGRQDPILTFQNTQRSIGVGFSVPSHSSEQARNNLKKLNELIKYLYPAYKVSNAANSISASPLFKIKFANLIYDASKGHRGAGAWASGLVCAIKDFQHQFLFDDKSGWLDLDGEAMPSVFTITFTADILHTHDLGRIDGVYQDSLESNSHFPYGITELESEQQPPSAPTTTTSTAVVNTTSITGAN